MTQRSPQPPAKSGSLDAFDKASEYLISSEFPGGVGVDKSNCINSWLAVPNTEHSQFIAQPISNLTLQFTLNNEST